MIEPLHSLRIDFDPETDNDGNAINTVETIEVRRNDGNVLLRLLADSIGTFRWCADIGCSIVCDWSISVSRRATIRINPPLLEEDDFDGA